jgi:hypothetical protein
MSLLPRPHYQNEKGGGDRLKCLAESRDLRLLRGVAFDQEI